ncbi:MAG: ABC transporter ATP-binding protein [Opitutaceae bacterium]|nr:ABC transporter ATP-binding protein [Opitutaceae bacterium]
MPTPSATPDAAEPVISLVDVAKTFTIWEVPSRRLLAPVFRLFPGGEKYATPTRFTALKPTTLTVRRGECVGIIGRNGAGKSTLLQILAGTLQPSEGTVDVRGRVAALLELGSGFNPDFTGRENVHLNASILGMTAKEIEARMPAILDYAGVGDFIDRPVRTFSSGMVVRLAFAVCAHVDADVLIIDEALAVGDARFQFKCFATLNQFLADGKTIIFVSHDSNSVKRLCTSAVLLEQGEMLLQGAPNDVVNIYTKLVATPLGRAAVEDDLAAARARTARSVTATGTVVVSSPVDTGSRLLAEERSHEQISDKEYTYGGEVGQISSLLLCGADGAPSLSFLSGDEARVVMVCEAHAAVADPIYAVTIKDVRGQEVFGTNTYFRGDRVQAVDAGRTTTVTFGLRLNLMPGNYFLSAGWVRLDNGDVQVIQRRYDAIRFEVIGRDRSFGIAYCDHTIDVRTD